MGGNKMKINNPELHNKIISIINSSETIEQCYSAKRNNLNLKTANMETNYKILLTKYYAHICDLEGHSYLTPNDLKNSKVNFTEEEVEIIENLDGDVFDLLNF